MRTDHIGARDPVQTSLGSPDALVREGLAYAIP